jgi:hypothetical protein
MSYGDIQSLKADADLVALGEVVGCTGVDSQQTAFGSIHSTDFAFEIESVLHGAAAQSVVVIRQTGGVVGGRTVEFMDDPLMQTGDRYVLFLKEGTSGLYHVLGGPQGRFVVRDERVSSLGNVYTDRVIFDPYIRDVSLEDFLEQIR